MTSVTQISWHLNHSIACSFNRCFVEVPLTSITLILCQILPTLKRCCIEMSLVPIASITQIDWRMIYSFTCSFNRCIVEVPLASIIWVSYQISRTISNWCLVEMSRFPIASVTEIAWYPIYDFSWPFDWCFIHIPKTRIILVLYLTLLSISDVCFCEMSLMPVPATIESYRRLDHCLTWSFNRCFIQVPLTCITLVSDLT